MGLFDLLGFGKKSENITNVLARGAVILDVRSKEEYVQGHIKGSKNIALHVLNDEIAKVKKWNKPIITCCRSGMRSAQAIAILKKNDIECFNGGAWQSLERKL
ncbi:rhodanese-like domain-containing protein [uncultured Flavobacterium sp.]|uniref:rhodanese-like domain-containing protein n=1 Tax=uncultured Flavobacterium sp. TaxID=165435 RepID=UPI0030CA1A28